MEEDIKILENFLNKFSDYMVKTDFSTKILNNIEESLRNLLKAYKELEEKQIIKNEKIRNGQPVIANTRLTILDVLCLMAEFIKRHEKEFRKDYADISINQIISAIDYFIENSIPVSLVEETIEELEHKVHILTSNSSEYEKMMEFRTEGAIDSLQELLERR